MAKIRTTFKGTTVGSALAQLQHASGVEWRYVCTGGNCTGFESDTVHGINLLITDIDGCDVKEVYGGPFTGSVNTMVDLHDYEFMTGQTSLRGWQIGVYLPDECPDIYSTEATTWEELLGVVRSLIGGAA